jgi:hypothetical protein
MAAMDKPTPQKPRSPDCLKCGRQPRFVTSMLDPPSGYTFHMFQCECGEKTWNSEASPPASR